MVFGAPSAFCIGMTSLAVAGAFAPSNTSTDSGPPAGAAARVAANFLLDQLVAGIEAHDGDLLALLVLAALGSGNCAHLPADQFATLDSAPPDRERRPLTIRQVAYSLGQPYETVRRRFLILENAGQIVRRGRNGFIVPEAVDRSPERLDAARRTHAKIQRMVNTLQIIERR